MSESHNEPIKCRDTPQSTVFLAFEALAAWYACAPRFAERKASPVTHGGSERPERKKSVLVRAVRRSAKPMPSTNTK